MKGRYALGVRTGNVKHDGEPLRVMTGWMRHEGERPFWSEDLVDES